MAIALDVSDTGNVAAASSLTFSHTCTGSNLMLIVGAHAEDATTADRVVNSVTYAAVGMTKIDEQSVNGTNTSSQWYLFGPATGANNVVITWAGTVAAGIGVATSLTGVAQQAPEAFAKNSGTGSSPITVTVTTVTVDAWVVDSAQIADHQKTLTPGAGQIQLSQLSDGNLRVIATYEGPVATPAATVMSNSWVNNNRDWATVAAAYAEAAAGGSTQPPRSMHQFRLRRGNI
ncbi:MAG: hypothetical protein HOO67_06210 [Candidatus Peribacteraceae bacterium]|nr:hypothetical protein [Candidatus Peribacteraceae bacterium]